MAFFPCSLQADAAAASYITSVAEALRRVKQEPVFRHSSRRVRPKDHRGRGCPKDCGHPPPDRKGEAAADPPCEHSPDEPHRQGVQGTGLIILNR